MTIRTAPSTTSSTGCSRRASSSCSTNVVASSRTSTLRFTLTSSLRGLDSDRRLSSLLGTRTLTSTAIRGVITSSKMLRRGLSRSAQVALTVLRPVLLAVAGVALAGRRASAAIAWTVCVMVAARSNNHNDRWALWVVGLALSIGIAALVEVKIRPAYTSPLQLWPYVYAAVGVVAGAVACAQYDWLQNPKHAVHGWSYVWMIPPVAAAASAAMLFFWMRWWMAAVLTGRDRSSVPALRPRRVPRPDRRSPRRLAAVVDVPFDVGVLADRDPRHSRCCSVS